MRDWDLMPAGADGLEEMIERAAREGWNPGLEDRAAFLAADPGGYWISTVDGRFAACMSLVHHHRDYAFLGFYMVDPALRGHGLGLSLWNEVLERSVARTVGLDGVVAQQDNYRRSGFAYAHANWRHGGPIRNAVSDPEAEPVSQHLLADALAYDARHNPVARPALMSAWLTDCPTRRSACLRQAGKIVGLGTIRACRDGGWKIGPLFADDKDTAERLFRHLAVEAAGRAVYLDTPGPNTDAMALCTDHGMTPVFETARMYRGDRPDLPLDRIYGITTFELG